MGIKIMGWWMDGITNRWITEYDWYVVGGVNCNFAIAAYETVPKV